MIGHSSLDSGYSIFYELDKINQVPLYVPQKSFQPPGIYVLQPIPLQLVSWTMSSLFLLLFFYGGRLGKRSVGEIERRATKLSPRAVRIAADFHLFPKNKFQSF